MGLYGHLRENWEHVMDSELGKQRLIKWRKEAAVTRIQRPTRLERARALGYKAKQGYVLVRVRVHSGGKHREKPAGGRRPSRYGRRKIMGISYQVIAEERGNKKYQNCEVLNSYYVAKDGKHYWYEVILVDRAHPQIVNDERIKWICEQRARVYRGLTSAGKKSRGLRGKGKGFEKARPSKHAYLKRKWKRQNLYRL